MTGSEAAKRFGATIVKDYLHFGVQFFKPNCVPPPPPPPPPRPRVLRDVSRITVAQATPPPPYASRARGVIVTAIYSHTAGSLLAHYAASPRNGQQRLRLALDTDASRECRANYC